MDDFKKLIIPFGVKLNEALRLIDENGSRILFLAEGGKLKASLSDGDIRRWILKGYSLDEPAEKAANFVPAYVGEDEREKVVEMLTEKQYAAVPVVSEDGTIVDVITFASLKKKKIRKQLGMPVVITAGGKGTRLYPYTKILPKPLIPVGDIPIIERIINSFVEYGCKDFYMIVNHKKNMIKAYFSEIEKDYNVTFIDEERPLGTGGGLRLLKGLVGERFFFSFCDTLIADDYAGMLEQHVKHNNSVTAVCSYRNFTLPYGVVEMGENGAIKEIKEKPKFSFYTNTGLYIIEPDVIGAIPETDGQVLFTDVMTGLMKSGKNVGVYPVSEKQWMDMGQFDSMEEMARQLEKNEL